MMKTVVIDDELSCREVLCDMLQDYCPEVEVVGTCATIEDAYNIILKQRPQLVFLDIIMPPGDGFHLLEKFTTLPFQYVFTTAHGSYALQALKASALDYLLKPVNIHELVNAVEKAKQGILKAGTANSPRRILITTDEGKYFIDPQSIIYIEAIKGHKSVLHFKDRNELRLNRDLSDYSALEAAGFFRSHRSFLINVNEVREYINDKNGGCVIMSDAKFIPVSSNRKEELIKNYLVI